MIKTIRSFALILALFLSLLFFSFAHASFAHKTNSINKYKFTTPPGLTTEVDFWIKIYSEYSTRHAVIHDMRNLGIVYEVVYLGKKPLSRRVKERKLDRKRAKYKKILKRIAKTKNKSSLKGEDLRIYKLVKKDFRKASRRIRVQYGLKDRFKTGIESSGLYMNEIIRILKINKLPEELRVLPHVESSFQLGAYSSAGAAGIWQFTRGTGRLFMRVGYDVDERRDPILATHGAAKLLKKNFEVVNSWPLAITAYNHGLQGIRRAQKRHGSDIVKIVRNYKSRTFGFASRNFYAEFLSALHVVQNQKKYFPNLSIKNPLQRASFRLPDYIHVNTAMKYFGMTREEIAESNPSLRRPVLNGEKRIPKGYIFQTPERKFKNLQVQYKKIPQRALYSRQLRSKWYTVRRGDTLSGVAIRFGTSVRSLKAYNNIGRRNRIYIGQVLQLPKGKSRPKFRLLNYTSEDRALVFYRIRRNDNLSKIAKRFRTDARYLAKINRIKNPNSLYPNQRIKVPQIEPPVQLAKLEKHQKLLQGDYYRVRKNDNLSKIAKRFDTDVIHLTSLNRMKDPNALYPGQKLLIAENTTSTLKNDHKKLIKNSKVKVDSVQAKKSLVDKSEIKSQGSLSGEPLRIAENSKNSGRLNKNRPAFMPVSFSSEKQGGVGTITVDFDETLSHYADWALLSIRELKKINRIKGKGKIAVHDKLLVSFKKVDPDKFEERRQEYHKGIQEDFFNNYDIRKLTIRSVEKGETLWEICNEIYTIPLWLLSSYNSDKDIHSLAVGEPIVVPVIYPKTG